MLSCGLKFLDATSISTYLSLTFQVGTMEGEGLALSREVGFCPGVFGRFDLAALVQPRLRYLFVLFVHAGMLSCVPLGCPSRAGRRWWKAEMRQSKHWCH